MFNNMTLTRESVNRTFFPIINFPKISIIMPSFNQEKFIERSILSVLDQEYPNLELIIIDGGSNDKTCEIIQKYNCKIFKWVSENDQGQSDALNKGFSWASGEIYGWLNSDDIYLPGAFKLALQTFKSNPDKEIVFGDWLTIDENDNSLDYHYAFDFNLKHFVYEGFHLNAQSMFWRSSVHKKFSGFDIELYNTMDYQMILEFGLKNKQSNFIRVPTPFGAFRRYSGQKTSGMTKRVVDEQKKIAEKYNFSSKYSFYGLFVRFYFRFRRGFWYLKRGGVTELKLRLKNAYFKPNK